MPTVDHSTLLLDATAMGTLLRGRLPHLDGANECRIHQTRRRVSRKTEEQGAPYLGVLYEFTRQDTPTPVSHWCYVKAFSRGASRTAPEAHMALHLEALDALAWTLPHDPAMPHLADFLNPDQTQIELRHSDLTDGDAAAPATVSIVRHEPESHCTARFELTCQARRQAVYGKTYADDGWVHAARRLRSLWTASSDADAFLIARPLGASDRQHAVWQQEVRGAALRTALHGAQAHMWLARVVRALARLQSGSTLGDAPLPPGELLARTIKQCSKLVRANASLGVALDPALDLLCQSVPAPAVSVTAHGDFHLDQMLCANERVALFDFDNFVAGSAALDVADFASQLLTDIGFDAQHRTELATHFIELCLTQLPQPPSRSELDWHLRALLLRKAYSFFVRHRSGWRERVLETAVLAARAVVLSVPVLRAA